MANSEKPASWARVEKDIRQGMALQKLPPDAQEQANEFLDHNELGVAFELLTNVLVERDIPIDPRARAHFAAAAEAMGLTANADWVALTGRVSD